MNYLLFDPRNAFSLEELVARVQQSKFGSAEVNKSSDSGSAHKIETCQEIKKTESKSKKNVKRSKSAKQEQTASEAGPRETILRFKQFGWLFNGYSGANRYLFQVPTDLKERFKEALERKLGTKVVRLTEEPQANRDEQQLLGEDVIHMLHFIHHNDIPLIADGSMYRRSILMILDRLSVREELPSKGEWRFGYGRRMKDYPNRMSLLYDYCYYNGWLDENGSHLTLTTAGLERLTLGGSEHPDKLYRFWLRLYKGAVPNIRAIVFWIDKLSKNWVVADSLLEALLPFIKPYYYDQPDVIFRQRIVGTMMHLGMLRIGDHSQWGQAIRMTPLGRTVIAGMNIEDEAIVLN